MLKEAETEETIDFYATFYHWRHFNWEDEAGPHGPPLGYAYGTR